MRLIKSTPINFVIPDVESFQSGGNIYNKNLINGLLEIGYTVKTMAWDAFSRKLDALEGYYFFDTLYFSKLEKLLPQKNKAIQCYLIVHHLESLYPPKGWTTKEYFQQKEYPMLKLMDGFMTSSQFTADYLAQNDLVAPKIVIPPAINFEAISKLKVETSEKPKASRTSSSGSFSATLKITIQAIMVANLVERKGILPFLQLLTNHQYLQQIQNLQIHLIGTSEIEPDYAKSCLTLIDQQPILKKIICYHGQLSPPRVHSLYQKADLFISTAFMETYGMALQEARAFQLPILALKGGNVENHVAHGETGWLVENMENLVHQLFNLVKHPKDLGSTQQYIINHASPQFYDWKAAARQFLLKLAERMS